MPINPILGTIVAENDFVALVSDKNGTQVSSVGHSLLLKLYQQDDLTRRQNAQCMQQVAARAVISANPRGENPGRQEDRAAWR